jgi:hypothetical protein
MRIVKGIGWGWLEGWVVVGGGRGAGQNIAILVM